MKRSYLASSGRTLSGGSKSISILRVQLERQVMRGVERDERNAFWVPGKIVGPKSDLGHRRVADDDAAANHVMRRSAEREPGRHADRTRAREHRDSRAALGFGDDAIEPAAHALREAVDALDTIDLPLVAR